MKPEKFDFSKYTSAIPAIPAIPAIRNEKTGKNQCEIAKIAGIAEAKIQNKKIQMEDDRHYCRECRALRNGYCRTRSFRPVDDIPRRCAGFSAYFY